MNCSTYCWLDLDNFVQHHLRMPNWLKLGLTLVLMIIVLAIFAAPSTDLALTALRAMRLALLFFALLVGVRTISYRFPVVKAFASLELFPVSISPGGSSASTSILRC